MRGLICMSHSELTRLEILQRIEDRRLNQTQAAIMLGLTSRQMDAWCEATGNSVPKVWFPKSAACAVTIDGRKPSGITSWPFIREHYADFGPTLAREKLLEHHGLLVPCETLRGWMKDAGIWLSRAAWRKAIQQPRTRRQYFGELIQIDGSEHRWFEDRGP